LVAIISSMMYRTYIRAVLARAACITASRVHHAVSWLSMHVLPSETPYSFIIPF
jgi:hypothetical protein